MYKKYVVFLGLILASCGGTKEDPSKAQAQEEKSQTEQNIETVQEQPKDALGYLAQAVTYLKEKKYREADEAARLGLAMDSLNPKVLLEYGNVNYLRNKTRISRDSWLKCVKLDPEETDCRMKLAELYLTVGELKNCLTQLDEVLKRDKKNYLANFIAGNAYLMRKDTTKAILYVQRSIEAKSDYFKSHDLLGVLYAELGNDLAIDYYLNAASLQPSNAEVYYKLGLYYQQKQMFEKAIESYGQSLQINPSNENIFYNLGYIAVATERYEKAIEHFSNAISLKTDYYEAYFGKAYAYEKLGDIRLSSEAYRSSLMINPSYIPAMDGLERLKGEQ